ncbi:MAG: prolyl oligopeptidase family serine peptidase [Acidobacteriota bacterium]|nr:prolyl oligopeptidase family serine peptidase [Acidobacteriota bacterium]
MRKTSFLLIVASVLSLASGAFAQSSSPNDGSIVEDAPCPARPAGKYEQYVEATKSRYLGVVESAKRGGTSGVTTEMPIDFTKLVLSREDFERRSSYAGVDCRRVKYLSDGLKVVGYIWKPKGGAAKKLPLVIFNRGGFREVGKLGPWARFGFYDFVSNGFVVIGSQYRGVDGGEGQEELGGADVRDVLNLIPLARSLGYVDTENIFIFGESRGGMMTYVALKNGIPVKAAAVRSSGTDFFGNLKDHPDLGKVYRQLIPDYDKRPDEVLRERSAIAWAEKINVPLLILHGGADELICAGRTLSFAQKLQELGKTYELIIYAGDDHALSLNLPDADKRIVEWFKKFMK